MLAIKWNVTTATRVIWCLMQLAVIGTVVSLVNCRSVSGIDEQISISYRISSHMLMLTLFSVGSGIFVLATQALSDSQYGALLMATIYSIVIAVDDCMFWSFKEGACATCAASFSSAIAFLLVLFLISTLFSHLNPSKLPYRIRSTQSSKKVASV
jgi:hypothetical protein